MHLQSTATHAVKTILRLNKIIFKGTRSLSNAICNAHNIFLPEYIQHHYIKTVHFWLKYNSLAIVRKTTKMIEGGHRGLQDWSPEPLLFAAAAAVKSSDRNQPLSQRSRTAKVPRRFRR